MRAIDIPQIEKLSTPEKILLVEDLWDQISENESEISIPESHKMELSARLADFNNNPGALLSLEELQERINHRK